MTTLRQTTQTTRTWTTVAGACALTGGALWLIKQAVIAVSADGAEPPENAFIGTIYLLAIPFMVVGASGVAVRLLGRSSPLVRGTAAALAPLIFLGVQTAADALVDALAGADAHWWWPSEGGIVLTALVFLGIGASLLAGRRRSAA